MRKEINFKTSAGRQRFYNSREWKAIRKMVLARDIFCVNCRKSGVYTAANEVDHIIDLKHRPDLCLDMDNLQGLCKSCHSEKTARENIYIPPKFETMNKKWDINVK